MSDRALRVAFFPDTYDTIDGVAHTSRQLEAFALRRNLPFLTIHGGTKDGVVKLGSTIRVTRRRGRLGFPLDKKHDYDLVFWRHLSGVEAIIREFDPDIVHVTGPSDVGQLGIAIAHRMRLPIAASWHTNVHEYAEQRALALLRFVPSNVKMRLGAAIRDGSLLATLRFYRIAQVLFAPNLDLVETIGKGTGKPCYPMYRGVNTELFDPVRRNRANDTLIIGYVGRLTVEKNIHDLAVLERNLMRAGLTNFRILIVGQGAEEPWLRANMQNAEFAGVLLGEALARAYSNMDIFAFPSQTDAFGNVVLEALASGVPAVVTNFGGPKFLVRPGETGLVAGDLQEFCSCVHTLATQDELRARMRVAARKYALTASWDAVFEAVYTAYERGLREGAATGKRIRMRPQANIAMENAG